MAILPCRDFEQGEESKHISTRDNIPAQENTFARPKLEARITADYAPVEKNDRWQMDFTGAYLLP